VATTTGPPEPGKSEAVKMTPAVRDVDYLSLIDEARPRNKGKKR